MKKILLFIVVTLLLQSCTDAFQASMGAYGKNHKIRMYNGGILVAEWISTGKVETMTNSDGWQFMDSKTKQLVRVGGDVIIEVIN